MKNHFIIYYGFCIVHKHNFYIHLSWMQTWGSAQLSKYNSLTCVVEKLFTVRSGISVQDEVQHVQYASSYCKTTTLSLIYIPHSFSHAYLGGALHQDSHHKFSMERVFRSTAQNISSINTPGSMSPCRMGPCRDS